MGKLCMLETRGAAQWGWELIHCHEGGTPGYPVLSRSIMREKNDSAEFYSPGKFHCIVSLISPRSSVLRLQISPVFLNPFPFTVTTYPCLVFSFLLLYSLSHNPPLMVLLTTIVSIFLISRHQRTFMRGERFCIDASKGQLLSLFEQRSA
ncbi:hypothetical protein F5Y17DRAFT_107930 [Xylariaceae sp. FL0594]|nr:hypothetical protein F5Y17DRAFT_107930 [Xylariaceae sp. FL0594]